MGGLFGAASSAHDEINVRQLMLMEPERFADDAAEPVALHAAAGGTNRNSKPQTRATLVIQERSHAKESITKPPAVRICRIEVRLAT